MIHLEKAHLEAIKKHGEETYPHECCGFLFGRVEGDQKQIVRVEPVGNAREDEARKNRYLISPKDFRRAEKEARGQKLNIVGFYHSHPDVEARPSVFDTEHAWPWYSYVIVSVRQGKAAEVRSWVLAEDRSKFGEEEIVVV